MYFHQRHVTYLPISCILNDGGKYKFLPQHHFGCCLGCCAGEGRRGCHPRLAVGQKDCLVCVIRSSWKLKSLCWQRKWSVLLAFVREAAQPVQVLVRGSDDRKLSGHSHWQTLQAFSGLPRRLHLLTVFYGLCLDEASSLYLLSLVLMHSLLLHSN